MGVLQVSLNLLICSGKDSTGNRHVYDVYDVQTSVQERWFEENKQVLGDISLFSTIGLNGSKNGKEWF